jgi:3D (Asp-Asp-Asp) domain-containing protein
MQLQISRSIPLTIQVDGQTFAIFSSARTTADILANAGIILGELDSVNPDLESVLNAGDTIQVVRVREGTIGTDEELPFQTVYQPSDELDLDTKAVISSGVPGILRRGTRIRYEDGVEVSREDEGEWMEQEPVNQVIGYGTRITTNMIDTPEGPREYWRVVNMRATAYTAASSGKPPDHPAYGITASGRPAGTGIVAVDPNVIPFRSEVYVPGYGVGFAGDTGGGVKGRWIDLGYDEEELQAWNGYVDVYYLTPLPAEINYLIPEVLP